MGKWEYLFVRGSSGGGIPRPAFVNGKEVTDLRIQQLSVYQYANALGDQGWELVNSDVEGKRLAFRRQKA